MKTTHSSALLSLLLLSAFNPPHSLFAQGSLTPPGAPAPMFRTLEEVQPRRPIGTNTTPGDANALFKITQPGSYFLTTNITGVAGKDGIFIAASGVTLDLMGFELVGVTNSLVGIAGGDLGSSISNVVVRNGTVRNWKYQGIETFNAENSQFQDLRLTGNGAGIRSGKASTIVNCSARFNRGHGFEVDGSVVRGCTAQRNVNDGIHTGEGPNVIQDCSVSYNGGNGINASDGCTVSGCVAELNTGNGIYVGQGCTVTACMVGRNTLDGIVGNASSSIYGCTSHNNNRDGIRVNEDCRVVDNTCVVNGHGSGSTSGDGINVVGAQNRIENNHVTDNRDGGIHASQIGNLIMRNSASGNGTNYVIVAGSKVGVIVAAPDSGAISGNTGGAGVGTTDPWANFSY